MKKPIVGWNQTKPVPDHQFNHYLNARNGELFFEDLNLADLFYGAAEDRDQMDSPLEIVYLPILSN